jgi:hypothetical protein
VGPRSAGDAAEARTNESRREEHMMPDDNETTAGRLLNQHPGLRERIRTSDAFREWRARHKALDVDGVQYFVAAGEPFVRGGDTLMDEDELMVEWAKLTGIIGLATGEGR